MFHRLVITSLLTTLAIMGSATTSSAAARDPQPNFGLPGVDIAAKAVDQTAAFLHSLSAIPGVSIGATATCGAANLLWALAGKPASTCGKEPAVFEGIADIIVEVEEP
ncbi:hypothetical protein Acor_76830 [Acrocarpospora corrugata]|uniref:Uncharacterized protein n=1 Tax=Acrocarpospora corrugata TaxID=35763 RepID=A0A5M3W956_9ACTN|nr:hypothetical protein [Acrocarpospora corrugata]GES05615.1 hypothetical protein Acor_76830 [Acrocarpospora corrugata]